MTYLCPSCAEEYEDEAAAELVKQQKIAQGKLRSILSGAIISLNDLSDLKLWPAEGWDYQTTLGTLLDLMPHRTDAQIEAWAKDQGL